MPKPVMYIFIKDTIPLGLASAAIAHASLGTYLHFQNDPKMIEWLNVSFAKRIYSVTPNQFEMVKNDSTISKKIFTESALDNSETAIGILPNDSYPDYFKNFSLFGKDMHKFETGDFCYVNNCGDLMMDAGAKMFINHICVIEKITKSGLVYVHLVTDKTKKISVPQRNISLKYSDITYFTG